MGCDQAAQPRGDDERLEHDGAGPVAEGLVEDFEDGDESRGREDVCKVADDGEEHGHAEEPARYEADTDCAHDGYWDHFLRAMDFLGQMGGAVEAGKAPVCVDEADDEGDTALLPARVVDEGCEDEFGMLVGGRHGRNSDEDDGKGKEGGPEGSFGDEGEGLAVAVEEEAEDVGYLVGYKNVPG